MDPISIGITIASFLSTGPEFHGSEALLYGVKRVIYDMPKAKGEAKKIFESSIEEVINENKNDESLRHSLTNLKKDWHKLKIDLNKAIVTKGLSTKERQKLLKEEYSKLFSNYQIPQQHHATILSKLSTGFSKLFKDLATSSPDTFQNEMIKKLEEIDKDNSILKKDLESLVKICTVYNLSQEPVLRALTEIDKKLDTLGKKVDKQIAFSISSSKESSKKLGAITDDIKDLKKMLSDSVMEDAAKLEVVVDRELNDEKKKMAKILHLYEEPKCLTTSYTGFKGFISLLQQNYIVDSKFAIVNDLVYKDSINEKFKKELIPFTTFLKNAYDILIIEGSPQPQSDFSKIDLKIVKEFFDKGGIIFHMINIGDLNSSDVSPINDYFKELNLGLGIDTYRDEYDVITGFDSHQKFRDAKEFIIKVDKEYRFRRTSYQKIFTDIERIAIGDPIHQKSDSACRSLLTGNPTTQLVSRGDYIVDDRILQFGKVNEKGGFYIFITGSLFEDYIVDFIENNNFKFGINLFEYFAKEQKERRGEIP